MKEVYFIGEDYQLRVREIVREAYIDEPVFDLELDGVVAGEKVKAFMSGYDFELTASRESRKVRRAVRIVPTKELSDRVQLLISSARKGDVGRYELL